MKHIHKINELDIEITDIEPFGFSGDGDGYNIYGIGACLECIDDDVSVDGWSKYSEPEREEIRWELSDQYILVNE